MIRKGLIIFFLITSLALITIAVSAAKFWNWNSINPAISNSGANLITATPATATTSGLTADFLKFKQFKKELVSSPQAPLFFQGYKFLLQDGVLRVSKDSKTVWETPDQWWADDFVLADSDNDGQAEINLSVWKSGDFGPFKPFWIKENDASVKNHFFVFNWENGEARAQWQSSNLTAPNCEISVRDINGDGQNELVVIEGDYQDWPACNGQYAAVWRWDGWGFENDWRSAENDLSAYNKKFLKY
jgi:hypothetical protein